MNPARGRAAVLALVLLAAAIGVSLWLAPPDAPGAAAPTTAKASSPPEATDASTESLPAAPGTTDDCSIVYEQAENVYAASFRGHETAAAALEAFAEELEATHERTILELEGVREGSQALRDAAARGEVSAAGVEEDEALDALADIPSEVSPADVRLYDQQVAVLAAATTIEVDNAVLADETAVVTEGSTSIEFIETPGGWGVLRVAVPFYPWYC